MSKQLAFVFPGQGSQSLGMLADLAERHPVVIDTFAEYKDGWGMAYWLHSVNSFLGGNRPQDLLATTPERVIEAALDEVQEVAHG